MKLSQLAFLVATLSASSVFAADAKEQIKIANFLPFSGSEKVMADTMNAAINFAAKQINEQGGINGKEIVIVPKDDGCDPKKSTAEAVKLQAEKIKYAIGFYCSAAFLPVIDTLNKQDILSLVFGTSDSILVRNNPSDDVFIMTPPNSKQNSLIINDMMSNHKDKKVAVVALGDIFTDHVLADFQTQAKAANLKIQLALSISKNSSEPDYKGAIAKIKSEAVDVVYYVGYHDDSTTFFNGVNKEMPNLVKYGTETIAETELKGVSFTTLPDFSKDAKNADLTKFLNDSKQTVSYFSYASYAALNILTTAMSNVKTEDVPKVRAELNGGKVFTTNIGSISYEKNGALKGINYQLVKK